MAKWAEAVYNVSMEKRILINARHPEEKRVAIIEGDTLIDFSAELASREYLKGNIYKGIITRIEPGMQAVFVNFGPKKHGFLQMRDVKSEYYRKKGGKKKVRIQEALEKGQELIVQVEKEERDTKGANLTTHISLPGRYIVMIPGREMVGVSRKIESREDRGRLKETFQSLKLPKGTGFILRTASSDTTEKELSQDLQYLRKLWNKIQQDAKKAPAPSLIYREHDLAVKTVRDYLTPDVTEVLVDDLAIYHAVRDYLRKTAPWRKMNIRLYKEKKPLFGAYGIEGQVSRISERYVYLPSKGYIVFDKTEALTAIDVNSGRSRKEKDEEATALRTNLEAAEEIARQLRLRDIGGLIVIDFIDMASSENRRDVEKQLRNSLSADKANTEITGISRFGIAEMTRERLRPPYLDAIQKRCQACSGSGMVKTEDSVALSALRDMERRVLEGGVLRIHCRLPVESANYLMNTKRDDVTAIEKESGIKITVIADQTVLPGNYQIDIEKSS